jgi:glucan biosynthesis protein C
METKSIQRRFDLDWLRVLAILSVFLYHSTRFFNLEDWHVKNPFTYAWVEIPEGFMEIWMMPVIFLISGASIFYAMNKGGAGKFFKDKVLRLLVPLVVAMFTHASWQVYLERFTHGQFSGSYFAFLPHYFEGVYLGDGSAGNFAFAGMHLWYLMILFIYCVIFYPLFRWWKGSGRGVLEKIGNLFASPWTMWLVMAFPIWFLNNWTDDTDWMFGSGGWPFLYYIFFFLYGFVIASHERLQANLKRARWAYLIAGLILSATLLLGSVNVNSIITSLVDRWDDEFYFLSACTLLPAFLGFAMQHLTRSTPFLKYANEAVLPFYILHQTVLLIVGYFIVQWAIPDLAKWMIIFVCSFPIILALYEFVVRRFNVMRVLFGMRPLARASSLQPKAVPAD